MSSAPTTPERLTDERLREIRDLRNPDQALKPTVAECCEMAAELLRHRAAGETLGPDGTYQPFTRKARAASDLKPLNYDHLAVSQFAIAMCDKLDAKRAEGRAGWDDPTMCTIESLAQMLVGHITKGDPIDIANFAMMVWHRGSDADGKAATAIQAAAHPPAPPACETEQRKLSRHESAISFMTKKSREAVENGLFQTAGVYEYAAEVLRACTPTVPKLSEAQRESIQNVCAFVSMVRNNMDVYSGLRDVAGQIYEEDCSVIRAMAGDV